MMFYNLLDLRGAGFCWIFRYIGIRRFFFYRFCFFDLFLDLKGAGFCWIFRYDTIWSVVGSMINRELLSRQYRQTNLMFWVCHISTTGCTSTPIFFLLLFLGSLWFCTFGTQSARCGILTSGDDLRDDLSWDSNCSRVLKYKRIYGTFYNMIF